MEEGRRVCRRKRCSGEVADENSPRRQAAPSPAAPLARAFPIWIFLFQLRFGYGRLIFRGASGLVAGSFYCMAFGVVGALIAAVPGFADTRESGAITLPGGRPPGTCSSTFAPSRSMRRIFICVVVALEVASVPAIGLALSFIGVVVLSISGYLGGTMVYDDGISVGRHRRRTALQRYVPGVGSDEVASEGEQVFNRGGKCSQLQEAKPCAPILMDGRHNWRKSMVNSTDFRSFAPIVMAAFRRCLNGTEIECPWHRSCFDVRSAGHSGPAKVDFENLRCESGGRKISVGVSRLSPAA